MKQVYICEKCGKQFDNWNDAYECERSHRMPTLINDYDLPEDFAIPPMQFNEGEDLPEVITMKFPVLDADGNYMEADGVTLYTCREYKLTPNRCPNRMDKFADGLHERALTDKAERERWRKEYEEKRKAEEFAQAQQESEGATDNENTEDSNNQ